MPSDDVQVGYRTACDDCGREIGMADRYCRWCGAAQGGGA